MTVPYEGQMAILELYISDFEFFDADLSITVADPHRAGAELNYYPGEVSLRMADVVVINKMDTVFCATIRLLSGLLLL